MLCLPRVTRTLEIVLKRPNTQYTAFLAGIVILGTCVAGARSLPAHELQFAQTPAAPATDPIVRDGLLSIAVVVTDAAGNPVTNLEPWDFTVLDNGHAMKIRTWHNSLAGTGAVSESAPELIFVVDAINLSAQQRTQTEDAIAHFLLRNNGPLKFQCLLYRLTRDGLYSSLRPSRDGTFLVKELEGTRSMWTVWNTDRGEINPFGAWESGYPRNQLSVRALGAIALGQRDVPGHKVVVWIGPGWPVNGGENGFDEATELSTRLREARITLDNVNVWLNPVASFNYHDYLEAPRSQKDMQPAKMALQVIALQTGGLVLDSSEDLDQGIDRSVEDMRSFYTLTFNPPHTDTMDEFHDLRVQVDRPGATVRAPMGYYNEPVYFDSPRPGIVKATVAQLEEMVHAQTDLLRKLGNVELTERVSTPRLDALLSEIHGERERQALTADADLSLALAPPAEDVVNRSPPSLGEQRDILRRAFDYLRNTIPKLPDFYALRNTSRFEEPSQRDNETWKIPRPDQTLHFATAEHATVLYRDGHEVVEEKRKLGKRSVDGGRARGLESRGTFGPILAYVLTDAVRGPSTIRWERWERGKYGDLAVFSYKVVNTNSGPELTYCCLPEGDGTTPYENKATTYGGEFAVNPDSGAIMRIVIDADLNEERDPDVPLIRSQIMVEYGPVELGGKTYICPQRSVEISRGRTERRLHEWGMSFSLYSSFETMINDVTFGGYHKFGSESRILPEFEPTQ